MPPLLRSSSSPPPVVVVPKRVVVVPKRVVVVTTPVDWHVPWPPATGWPLSATQVQLAKALQVLGEVPVMHGVPAHTVPVVQKPLLVLFGERQTQLAPDCAQVFWLALPPTVHDRPLQVSATVVVVAAAAWSSGPAWSSSWSWSRPCSGIRWPNATRKLKGNWFRMWSRFFFLIFPWYSQSMQVVSLQTASLAPGQRQNFFFRESAETCPWPCLPSAWDLPLWSLPLSPRPLWCLSFPL